MSEHSIFETLLASTVHDMKNSLGFLINQVEDVSRKYQGDSDPAFSNIEFEASRVNILLLELLSLYRLEKKQLPINIDEVVLIDFLEDCIAGYSRYARHKNINIILQCDEDLIWFFDSNLIGVVINNVIGNSIRYASNQVSIKATLSKGALCLLIEDDGKGYPEHMIHPNEVNSNAVNVVTGSTGLGLYFSKIIADNHRKGDNAGSICFDNLSQIGGARFQISLP